MCCKVKFLLVSVFPEQCLVNIIFLIYVFAGVHTGATGILCDSTQLKDRQECSSRASGDLVIGV